MQWDLNDGRYTTVLRDGVVVHATKVEGGWEILIPARWIRETVRNPGLRTWLRAQAVVEKVLMTWEEDDRQA